MNADKKRCDLCQKTIELPGFEIKVGDVDHQFCCEGCKGIYQLLYNDTEVLKTAMPFKNDDSAT